MNLVLIFLAAAGAAQWLAQFTPIQSAGVWIALSLIFVAAAIRQPLLWSTTAVMGFAPLVPNYLPAPAWQAIVHAFAALNTTIGFLCLLAAGSGFLASLVHDGGTAHRAFYDRLQKRRRDLKSAMEGDAVQSGSGWFWTCSQSGYRKAFDKLLARAADGRAGFGREMLALGPQAHLTATAMGLIVLFVIMTIVLSFLWMGGVFDHPQAGAGVANSMFGLLGTLMGGISQLHGSIVRRHQEECLVALLPGVPRGQAFNRQLGRALMRHFFLLWGGGSLLMGLALCWIPGTSSAILAFPVVLVGGGLVLLRDWSRAGPFKGWLAVLFYLPLALAALILAPLYVWRWRVMMRAPMAWPAARR